MAEYYYGAELLYSSGYLEHTQLIVERKDRIDSATNFKCSTASVPHHNPPVPLLYSKVTETTAHCSEMGGNVSTRTSSDIDNYFKDKKEKFAIGLEWGHNSCFIDSTFHALFLFNNKFSTWLFNSQNYIKTQDESYHKFPEQRRITHNLVKKVQSNEFVLLSEKIEFMKLLFQTSSNFVPGSMGDAEHFLEILFQDMIGVQPFLKYDNDSHNYIHQLLFDSNPNAPKYGSLNSVFNASINYQGLQFKNLPLPALIIKFPVDNGQLIHFCGILPNLKISLPRGIHKDITQYSKTYHLSSIIILKGLHYTTFVRDCYGDGSMWFYCDSTKSKTYELPNLTQELNEAMSKFKKGELRDLSPVASFIMRYTYICIYFPDYCTQKVNLFSGFGVNME